MIDFDTKLYVQLAPDDTALAALKTVQASMPADKNSQLVSVSALHVTVLHFGLIERVFQDIHRVAAIDPSAMLSNTQALLAQLQKIIKPLQSQSIRLCSRSFDHFGKQGTTLVISFEDQPLLTQLHADCLRLLRNFFAVCGVTNIDKFIRTSDNFNYASNFRPHVALAKGYTLTNNLKLPAAANFCVMPLTYDS